MNEFELFSVALTAIESGLVTSDEEADTLARLYLLQRAHDEAAS